MFLTARLPVMMKDGYGPWWLVQEEKEQVDARKKIGDMNSTVVGSK